MDGSADLATAAIADTDAGVQDYAKLAAAHGLSVAGARPDIFTYTRQLWAYRHFITTYSTSGIAASFAKARLGRLWQVLTPLSNAAVYYLIFGLIIGSKGRVDNYIAYLCAGVFIFGFTSQVAMQGTLAVTKNIAMIRALHFPRATMPLASTYTQLQNLVAALLVLLVIVLGTGEPITWKWLLLIPAVLLQTMFNIGLGLTMARLGSKLTDLRQILPFVLRTWMYVSGVMYAATNFDKNLPAAMAFIAKLNPLAVYIDIVRYALLDTQKLGPPPQWVLNSKLPESAKLASQYMLWSPTMTVILAVGWAVVLLVGGYIYFWRGEGEYGRG
jgi:teichoic acid transport system permease protein